ncbi:hypothetical protein ACJX0J_031705, partial [Zea mays]
FTANEIKYLKVIPPMTGDLALYLDISLFSHLWHIGYLSFHRLDFALLLFICTWYLYHDEQFLYGILYKKEACC